MVTIPPELYQTYSFVSSIFMVRPEWLVFPNMITVFIIPFVLNIFMFYFLFTRMLRVLPFGSVNTILAVICAYMALPFNQVTSLISPLVIGFFLNTGMVIRIIVIVALYATYFIVVPWLTNFFLSGSFAAATSSIF